MAVTGSGPDDVQRFGVPIADLLAGMYGAYGVLAALRERDRTGRAAWCAPSRGSDVIVERELEGVRALMTASRLPGTCRMSLASSGGSS